MKERPEEDDIIGSRPAPRSVDFGLFAGEPTNEEPAPAPAEPTGPPMTRAVSTKKRARSDSMHEAGQTKARALDVVMRTLVGSGGLTRREIAAVTGLPVNTVNGRVADLLTAPYPEGGPSWAVCGGKRGNESVVWRRGEEPPEVETEAKPIRHRYEGIVVAVEVNLRHEPPSPVEAALAPADRTRGTVHVTLAFPIDAAPEVTTGAVWNVGIGPLPASTALPHLSPEAHTPDPDAEEL